MIEFLKEETEYKFENWECRTCLVLPNAKSRKQGSQKPPPGDDQKDATAEHTVLYLSELDPVRILAEMGISKNKVTNPQEFEAISATLMVCHHSMSFKTGVDGAPILCSRIPSDLQLTHAELAGPNAPAAGQLSIIPALFTFYLLLCLLLNKVKMLSAFKHLKILKRMPLVE